MDSESDSDSQSKQNTESEEEGSAVEDHVEYSEHDTDSQQSENSEEDVPSSPTPIHGNYYYGKDKTTKWNKVPPPITKTRKHNIITHLPGCKGPSKNVTRPSESFFLFFDDFVFDLLVENTNKYIVTEVKDNFSRERDARLVTKNEIKAFLGILIAGGVMRSSHLNFDDLFSVDDMGNEFFYTTMNKQRFLFILRCVRFDDKATRAERQETDKLAAIRTLFDYLVDKCGQLFTPSEYLTIDEQLVAFRGHCNFRQYMPSKPNKYGIKIFALVDARNFYNLKMEVYLGSQPEGPFQVSNSPGDVVTRLISPISKSGRNITVDNWFTSIPLAENLLKNHKLTLVGTLRKNKREVPPEFQPNKTRAVKSTLFGFTTTITMMSYVPKKGKSVMLISTLHKDTAIDKESGDAQKAELLTFYNMTKGGVDTNDKLCATYNVGRRTRRWPVAIFFHLINVCAINALVIYNSGNNGNPLNRREFLKKLGRELAEPFQRERMDDPHIPRNIRKRLYTHFDEETVVEPPAAAVPKTKKRCHICPRSKNKASRVTCIICNKHVCQEHQRTQCSECYE
ncbi:uncharacterized protein CBL_05132 [Carabus blaptoides fortunei]